MTGARLDHLVVAAADLAAGVAWAEARLGVAVPAGGVHERMGTHNHVLSLGAPRYLEVIAVDPAAPAPGRPRWFGLDEPAVAARIAARPRLIHWVVAVDDLEAAVARLPYDPGTIHEMTRGDLVWRITIPDDGRLIVGGLAPTLIEWPSGVHPTARMPPSPCRLAGLVLRHPEPARIAAALAPLGPDLGVPVAVAEGPVALAATIETPGGTVVLD